MNLKRMSFPDCKMLIIDIIYLPSIKRNFLGAYIMEKWQFSCKVSDM